MSTGAVIVVVVNICTDYTVSETHYILIDTRNVPVLQQTSCKCVISPARQIITLVVRITNHTGETNIKFQIANISVTEKVFPKHRISGDTELLLSTDSSFNGGGVCLGVYTVNGTLFNIMCTKSARQASTSQGLIVSVIFGVVCFLVIVFISAIYFKRRRAETKTNSTTGHCTSTRVESENRLIENSVNDRNPTCMIGSSEHNNVQYNKQNEETVASHYDSIQESTTDGNLSSENPTNHVALYDHAICHSQGQAIADLSNNKTPIKNIEDQQKWPGLEAKDDTVYDSTKAMPTQQAIVHNDYDHLNDVCLTGKSLTYDTVMKVSKEPQTITPN
ncbi:uncharacterized protein LOC132743636 isoform X2 [Ruditapes philippinarum]|uniref:uncharacterized protein LOC132743636 isoform X2 n=1 Tax=Ruditapes philippinarum TaxID=129788 RepID=UPI00295A6FAF|nr:uncharacterized protein LOC132743636 isoform X2 [Ruditapes philippinarum]